MNSLRRNDEPDRDETAEELRRIGMELAAIRKILDHFAGVYLNAKFPFGKATDRWFRR
jgi:hypothetical protein